MARTLRSDLRALASRAGDAVPGWVGGAMAALQSALLSVGAVVAVALAVAAVSPPADGSAGVDWQAAASVGTRIWLLAHAVPAGGADTPVSLVPLGMTAVFAFLASSLARRFAAPTTGSLIAFTATYAGILVASEAAADAALTDPHAAWRAGVAGALVAGIGGGSGLWRAGWRPGAWTARIPRVLADGVRLGLAIVLASWALGALVFILWSFAGWSDIGGAASTLGADPVGSLALAVGEALYAPTLAIWGMAWFAGPGFAVGSGTVYAPGHLETAPLPSVPILGALPHASGGLLVLAPALVVAVAALCRGVFARRRPTIGAPTQVVAVAVVALLAGASGVAARGSIGGGTFAAVGPEPIATAVWMGCLAALGLALASLVARWRATTTRTGRTTGKDGTATDEAARRRRSETPSDTGRSPRP